MNIEQKKRQRMIWKWKNAHPKYCREDWRKESPEVLAAQEKVTKEIAHFCENQETKEISGMGFHEHICTFAMLSNDKQWQNAQCNEWRKIHNIQIPEEHKDWAYGDRYDYCDYCPMMNYVALDDEGKIMYVQRTFPEDREPHDTPSYKLSLTIKKI